MCRALNTDGTFMQYATTLLVSVVHSTVSYRCCSLAPRSFLMTASHCHCLLSSYIALRADNLQPSAISVRHRLYHLTPLLSRYLVIVCVCWHAADLTLNKISSTCIVPWTVNVSPCIVLWTVNVSPCIVLWTVSVSPCIVSRTVKVLILSRGLSL